MKRLTLVIALSGATLTSACSYYSQELEDLGVSKDFSGVSSYDLCDAASYFYYDMPDPAKAKKVLNEVLKRGDISRRDYNSALTGDVELGMSDLAATCAWGLPSEENEYYLSNGQKFSRWKFRYSDGSSSSINLINDRVVEVNTAY